MLIVFISTLAGYRLKQIMLSDRRDVRLVFLCASFFSAALSAGGQLFGIGSTPEIALGTSVLYLIPGVPYINAVSDIIYKHYIVATLAVGYAIAHEHGDTIEFQSVNLDTELHM